ncbi:UvrD-helicase domain-containing protein [Halobacillus campisalis]|uniref:UvrD-helicase domain-containing protein n=1 Tax=Halobacillus campisalis TaxID=435909 RepID=A0ABW2K8P0_9BACI|nr:UvrD-helicase domain-containing protein [Halobacillus campisalis]
MKRPYNELNIQEYEASVNNQIMSCLDPDNLKSFFLFAGAGSGKTRSLVQVLDQFKFHYGNSFRIQGRKVAVITYTNAARDEIERRLQYDPLFYVSTIHSFIWGIIKPFQIDIKKWLINSLSNNLQELSDKLQKGRTRDPEKLKAEISSKERRLEHVTNTNQFIYSPDGDNQRFNSINHSDVIKIGQQFLMENALMQKILKNKYPVLLIDESQDTSKYLIEALFEMQEKHKESFSLGLFGDTMQRIYSDGKHDLGSNLPDDWITPVKEINHRCPTRIIKLINKIREPVDNQDQVPGEYNNKGIVRMFLCPSDSNKELMEEEVARIMSELTKDGSWSCDASDYKTLILEHHMAANRLGFSDLFQTLYSVKGLQNGVLDGNLPELSLFTKRILPIIRSNILQDDYTVTKIVNKYSPLLDRKHFNNKENQVENLKLAKQGVQDLLSLWTNDKEPMIEEVIQSIYNSGLFTIPEKFKLLIEEEISQPDGKDNFSDELDAWKDFIKIPFSQIEAYDTYIKGDAKFETHQGVKGLEYPRIMVVIDDEESRGFMFSYEKLFGAKKKTATDLRNEAEGKDSSVERTRRLFYVTCSRAQESLAIVAYSNKSELIKTHLLEENWLDEDEIIIMS